MIKHNIRLPANLMGGIKQEVRTLVDRLLVADELQSVQINLRSWEGDRKNVRNVLEPLSWLTNVRGRIEVFGLPPRWAWPGWRLLGDQNTDWRKRKCTFVPGDSWFEIQ